jgi:hypothetical protein
MDFEEVIGVLLIGGVVGSVLCLFSTRGYSEALDIGWGGALAPNPRPRTVAGLGC